MAEPGVYVSSNAKIVSVFNEIRRDGFSKREPFGVGNVEKRMKDFARAEGITLAPGALYVSPSSLAHATRGSKMRSGISLTEKELAEFPKRRKRMDLFYDTDAGLFFYVDKGARAKYVIHPSYEIKIKKKRTRKVNFVTASRLKSVDNFYLDRRRYRGI